MSQAYWTWNTAETPAVFNDALNAIAESLCMEPDVAEAKPIHVELEGLPGQVTIDCTGETPVIRAGDTAALMRGLADFTAGLAPEGQILDQKRPFSTLGVMIDLSRNGVMKVESLKRWFGQLALLGFNTILLYCEDVYKLPDEDYFGYLRGRYSGEDLRELDAYAETVGIELVGCIQTLGHLEQILRWGDAYADIKDTDSVLLVGEEKTYALIEKMMGFWSKHLKSRRIHIGMDEAYGLGCGNFLKKYGYQRPFDILNAHLSRVRNICHHYHFKPMIWSDMYFTLGCPTGHYRMYQDGHVPDDVKAEIPRDVQLVYWDYGTQRQGEYEDCLRRHAELCNVPVLASGVHTWGWLLWYSRRKTEAAAGPATLAARETRTPDLIYTLWGDDGAYCDFDSALAGLAWCAELAWSGNVDQTALGRRFSGIFGVDYETVAAIGEMDNPIPPGQFLWDDPLLAIVWKKYLGKDSTLISQAIEAYENAMLIAQPLAGIDQPMDFGHIHTLLSMLTKKLKLQTRLMDAYLQRDLQELENILKEIPDMLQSIEASLQSFRQQWFRRNKPNGFETLQIRFGGLKERYRELERRLKELLDAKTHKIEELDEIPENPREFSSRYRNVATSSVIL